MAADPHWEHAISVFFDSCDLKILMFFLLLTVFHFSTATRMITIPLETGKLSEEEGGGLPRGEARSASPRPLEVKINFARSENQLRPK